MKGSARSTLARHAVPTRRYAKLIEVILAFGLMGLIWAGEFALIRYLQTIRCPQSTFLSGSPRIAGVFIILLILIAGVVPGFLLSNLLTGAAPATRRFFDGNSELRKSRAFRRTQIQMARFGVSFTTVALTASFVASLNQFCLTDKAIFTRAAPWERMRSYPWSAVETVTTSCVRGTRGAWDPGYVLGLSDGTTLDIMEGMPRPWMVQHQIFAVLHPVAFEFDTSKVSPNCTEVYLDMLLQRP